MSVTAVVDTNVFISAMLSRDSGPRSVLSLCFEGKVIPLMGTSLYLEYSEVIKRQDIFKSSPMSEVERDELLNAFLNMCEWKYIYYLWRPNLVDEGDNHLVELAVAGGADYIVTGNEKDFAKPDLLFADLRVVTPRAFVNIMNNNEE